MSKKTVSRLSVPPARDYARQAHAGDPSGQITPGMLYGVGVGPGSPDLLTLRAINVLRSVRVILAASSPGNDYSLALSIASPHLPEDVEVIRLDFPMTRDRAVLEASWNANAEIVADVLDSGRDAAFLTLGDPLIYSTFGYLMRTLHERRPSLPVSIVPGITSYQEAAAKTRTILCEGGENLLLIPGINNADTLGRALDVADSAIILKAYRNFGVIRDVLRQKNRSESCLFASRLGLDNEITIRGLEKAPENPHYLSLVLTPPDRPHPAATPSTPCKDTSCPQK